jgi:amidohydrolase
MDFLKTATANEALLIEMRRHLHENPELSDKEYNTIEYIKEKLTEFGVEFVEIKRGGILAHVGDASKGKTVLLRGDCDALPVPENPENLKGPKACISKIDGISHACGHDAHTAMLLGAAKILKEMESELKGIVYLVFERGEEATGNFKYIFRYFQENNFKFDAIYGTHTLSTYEAGKISLEPGGVMAGGVGFNIIIRGRGGHGSRPDLSISPIDCFSAFNMALNGLRLKYISPFEALCISIGTVKAGVASNVIPDEIQFAGSARVLNKAVGVEFRKEFLHLLEKTTEAYHCTYEILLLANPGNGVINNADLSAFGKEAIAKHVGSEYVGRVDPWMASESFSLYLQLFPGVFAFLGMKNPEKGVGAEHHNEKFDVDEDVLKLGVAAQVAYAYEFLENPITPEFTPYDGTALDLLKEVGFDNFED